VNRGKPQLNKQFLVTAIAQYPLMTRVWNTFWLDERNGMIPGTALTN